MRPTAPTICGICGGVIDPRYRSPHPASFSVDHTLAQALGGTNHPANLQPAHRACNCKKGAAPPTLAEAAALVSRLNAAPPVKARLRRRQPQRLRRIGPPSTLVDALRDF